MNWFRRQLDIAHERTARLPNWARREAGLPTMSSDDTEQTVSTCPMCGQPVTVGRSAEGTNCYLPTEETRLTTLRRQLATLDELHERARSLTIKPGEPPPALVWQAWHNWRTELELGIQVLERDEAGGRSEV